ncbi:MAG: hypothetical protein ACK4UN_19430, partial [Limisphaerales bacterium]
MPIGMVYQVLVRDTIYDRRFLYVSANCENLNGITAEEVMADPFSLHGLLLPEHRRNLFERQ